MGSQPGSHTERLICLDLTGIRHFQSGADFHPHVRPEPRAFAPDYRRSRCRNVLV